MAQTTMKVKVLGSTQLNPDFIREIMSVLDADFYFSDGQAIALSAIRSCYSPNRPSEIVKLEGKKYFGTAATDGGSGSDADRLFRHIVHSGHTSTMEHISFTFAVEGVSRALLAQLTRHRVGFSYSVQSQRYVKFSSNSKSGGFDYVVPEKIKNNTEALIQFHLCMRKIQAMYDHLQELGIPQEDARAVLPQASACNLVMTANLRALFEFYSKRRKGSGAQHEISELAEAIRKAVTEIEPWTDQFFEQA